EGSAGSRAGSFEQEILNTRQEIALETLQILRSRYRREKEYWNDLFEKKDHEIKILNEKLKNFEKEISEVHEQLNQQRLSEMERLKSDVDSFKTKQDELARHEEAFTKEMEFYRRSSEAAHTSLAVEKEHFQKLRDQWDEKEKQWQHLIADREEETAAIRQEYAEKELDVLKKKQKFEEEKDFLELEISRLKSALSSSHKQGKEISEESSKKIIDLQVSLDKAYKQLEMEQKLRDINLNEFKHYKLQIEELKEGRARMIVEWDAERKQWKELWEKERLIWEKRKDEVIEWEKRLRQERERWILSGVPEPEKLLRDLLHAPQPVPEMPGGVTPGPAVPREKKMYLRPIIAATWNAVTLKRRTKLRRILVLGLIGIPTVLSVFFLYKKTAIYQLPDIRPAALAIGGSSLVVYDKAKASLFYFKPDRVAVPKQTFNLKFDSLSSFVISGGFLWSCDPAEKIIYLHRASNPAQIEGTFPAPGNNTTLLAWDGEDLWSYDAEKLEIYLHKKDYLLSVEKTFVLPDIEPTAICWWKGFLWVYDALTHEVVKYKNTGEALKKVDGYFLSKKLSLAPVRDVTGMCFYKGGLWLSGEKKKILVRYNFARVKLYNFPF
ncbi:MAG: hypothetical protein ABII23_09180, partial [bacterium]